MSSVSVQIAENPVASESAPQRPPFERRAVLSASVDLAAPRQFLDYLVDCAQSRTGRSVVGISAPYASAMARNATLREVFSKADLLIPDGQGFVWGARLLGVDCGERLAIPDLCEQLLIAGNTRGWKVFIYGATPEANAAALQNLKSRFPNLTEVAGQHGYNQTDRDENALIARLRDEKFNLLIVARPTPDKEQFLARCCPQAGVVGLAAGGYVDILAGLKKRAPGFVQALGMEWLYRLGQDPLKLWRRIGWANVKFAASVLWNWTWGVPRRPWFAQPLVHVLTLIAVVVLAYGRSLNAPYHFDDPEYIMRNTAIRSLKTLDQITVTSHRKLWWLSNAICYRISERLGAQKQSFDAATAGPLSKLYHSVVLENFGNHQPNRPDVRVFRAWNIACHLVAALALYGLLRRCLRALKLSAKSGPLIAPDADMRPFAAAAIFAAHPLATEAVTYISGRDNGQGGMFYLLGLYFAAVAFERIVFPRAHRDSAPVWPKWVWPAGGMLGFGAASLLTKESYLTYPIVVAVIYFAFYHRNSAARISAGLMCGIFAALLALAWGAAGRGNGALVPALQVALVALIAGGLLGGKAEPPAPSVTAPKSASPFKKTFGAGWGFVFAIAGLIVASVLAFPYVYLRIIDALTGHQGSSFIRSLETQAHAVPQMLARAVAPVSVTFSPDFNIGHSMNIDHQFPTIASAGDSRVWIGAAILAVLVVVGIAGLLRGSLASFGVLLALISILPTNTIVERGDIVSERNFYLAAAGGACVLAAIAAAVARLLVGRIEPKGAGGAAAERALLFEAGLWTLIFACCFAGPFTAFTIVRNYDWGDPYRLWKMAMERSPDKMRVLYNFGVSAQQIKRLDEAEAAFTRAIAIGEELSKRKAFRPDEAVDLKCFHLSYARLAEVFQQRYTLSRRPGSPAPTEADQTKAIKTIKEIYEGGLNRTAWDPDLATMYAEFLINIGQAPEVIAPLQKSWNYHTWADQLYFPLGIGNLESGHYGKAADYFEKAALITDQHALGFERVIDPGYIGQAYTLLGLARARMGMKAEATAAFKEALTRYPDAVLDIFLRYRSARNLNLPMEQTRDDVLNALSQVHKEVLIPIRDAAGELAANPPPGLAPNVVEYKRTLDYELDRRETWQRKRREAGFKDDPEAEEK